MKRANFQIAVCFAFLAIALTACTCLAQSPDESITVDGARPVARALEKLETIYVFPIFYEDIRSVSESEAKRNEQGHLVPKGGTFSFDYTPPPPDASMDVRKTLALAATESVLKSYETERGVSMFAVKTLNEGLDVVPIKSATPWGNIEDLQPLLDTPVSISPGHRTAYQVIQQIAQQISAATGRVTNPGTVPMPLFYNHMTDLTAQNEAASSVLERLFQEMPIGYTSKPATTGAVHIVPGGALSWEVFCSPELNWECAINIHTVTPTGRSSVPLEGVPPKAIRPENQ